MAGEPALEKVLVALKGVLDAAPGAELGSALNEIDRADDNPFGNAELPAVNIMHRRTRFSQHSHGETLHIAEVDLDMIVATEAASTNGARLRILEADIVAALWTARTLGGLAQDVQLQSSGGDEDVLSDEGARPLSIEILFLTPVGDHRTVIGTVGLVP